MLKLKAMKRIVLFLFIILSTTLHATDTLKLYISKVNTANYPYISIIGVVFHSGQVSILESEHIFITEEGRSITDLNSKVLLEDEECQILEILYRSSIELNQGRDINIKIDENGWDNGYEGQNFNLDKDVIITGNNEKLKSRIGKRLSDLNIDNYTPSIAASEIKSSNANRLDYSTDFVGKIYYHYDPMINKVNSFTSFADDGSWGGIEFKENELFYINGEESFDAKITNIQQGSNSTKIMVQEYHGEHYQPWFLSFNKDGLLEIRSVDNDQMLTKTYIEKEQLNKFTYLDYPSEAELMDESVAPEEEYEYYYLIKEDLIDSIKYINYYKGCPLREKATIQSKMKRYLLENEPVSVIEEGKLWTEIKDIFGETGFIQKRFLGDSIYVDNVTIVQRK